MSAFTITLELDGIDLADMIRAVAACNASFRQSDEPDRYVSITVDIGAGRIEVRGSSVLDLFYLARFHGHEINSKEQKETWAERLARAKLERGDGK